MESAWRPDLLGPCYEQRALPGDAAAPAGATLVRRREAPSRQEFVWPFRSARGPLTDVDVLFVHGWSDYFFQTGLADFWHDLGARFFALDLRRYGRSLREGDLPGFVSDLSEYDADIEAAIAAIAADPPSRRREEGPSPRRLVLVGHSTGGLTLALWTARHPGTVSALVLNSPWLEFQAGAAARTALSPMVRLRAEIDPYGAQPNVDLGYYTRAQRLLGVLPDHPERTAWRPDRGFPTHPAWLAAVLAGHREIAAGRGRADCPVLVLLARGSTSPLRWEDAMLRTDSVLVVDDIAAAATRLGDEVEIRRIDGAIHDVFLSAPDARERAFSAVRRWALSGALPARPRAARWPVRH